MIKNIIIILIMLGFVASVIFLDVPIIQSVLNTRKEVESKQQALSEKEIFIKNIERLIQKYKGSEDVLKNLDIILPEDSDVPNLIVQIEAIANQSGVNIVNIGISISDEKGESKAAAARSGASASQVKSVTDYKTIIVDLEVEGDYATLKSFLQVTEANMRLMNIESIEFSQKSQQDSGSVFTFNVVLNTYYYAN